MNILYNNKEIKTVNALLEIINKPSKIQIDILDIDNLIELDNIENEIIILITFKKNLKIYLKSILMKRILIKCLIKV